MLLVIPFVSAAHDPVCVLNNPYVYTTNQTSYTTNTSVYCSDAHGLTQFNISCDNAYKDNRTLSSTSFLYNLTTTLNTPTTICNLSIADDSQWIYQTMVLIKIYGDGTGPFQVNSCPSDTPNVMLYVGMLFFFLSIVVIAIVFRVGMVGILGSLALLSYSWFVSGCYAAFGWIFMGIGVILFLYFALGKYS